MKIRSEKKINTSVAVVGRKTTITNAKRGPAGEKGEGLKEMKPRILDLEKKFMFKNLPELP